jgi:rSAM/selenodomain-associated transferase 1
MMTPSLPATHLIDTSDTVAVGVICKTPAPGKCKTRLSPLLFPEECAALSACFISDLARTIHDVAPGGGVTGYALYTPIGSEPTLGRLLPPGFRLMPQADGDLGSRLFQGLTDFLNAGHAGAILINSDSPTLPAAIIVAGVDAVLQGDNVVLSPAFDGGYTLVGLSNPRRRLFEDITWSTPVVYEQTLARAREIGIAVTNVPMWYDIDDAASLAMLEDELIGNRPPFSQIPGADAPATRRFLRERQRQNAMTAV